MTTEEMISEIKQRKDKNGNPYQTIRVKGGTVRLEDAPKGNIYFMWKRVTGKTK